MTTIVVPRPGAPWHLERPAEKLLLRARLPGAFVDLFSGANRGTVLVANS